MSASGEKEPAIPHAAEKTRRDSVRSSCNRLEGWRSAVTLGRELPLLAGHATDGARWTI